MNPAPQHNFIAHLEARVRDLENALTQAQLHLAGQLAADTTRRELYSETLTTYGPPPQELLSALHTQGMGWRCAWIPLAPARRRALVLLPPEVTIDPYLEAAVWRELADHRGQRHLAAVPPEIHHLEFRALPHPLLAYVREPARIVVDTALPPEARNAAVRSIWRIWLDSQAKGN